LLKLKQMRDALPTSYKVEEASKDPTPGRKKKIAEVETQTEVPEPKAKRAPKKQEPKAPKSKAKAEEPRNVQTLHKMSADKEDTMTKSKPVVIAEPAADRSRSQFTLQNFDLPEELILGANDMSKIPKHVHYPLDEGFSLEIPSSFSKSLQTTPRNNIETNTNVIKLNSANTAEKSTTVAHKEKTKKDRGELKNQPQESNTRPPAVTAPSDEEESDDDEASEASLEEYIADEVMQIDPEEASALDLVLQNGANQEQTHDARENDSAEDEDDYMSILNEKVAKSLEDINVQDIMKGTPNMLKQMVINSFVDVTPRKHQWEAVYNIIRDILMSSYSSDMNLNAGHAPPIKNYLIQHSAGSGKSLTIACLVYMLYILKVSNQARIVDSYN